MNELQMRIPLSNPDITETEIEAVVQVLRTGRLSLGPKLAEFEGAMAAYVSAAHAVALSSGTAGLHLGLQALEIGEGDEVIVPSFTFVAAANSIRHVRATPVFVDIDSTTLNLDSVLVERAITPRTRAIMAVHTFECPANLNALLDIANKHGLYLIEDACEALGAEYHNRKVGAMGAFGVFSFYPNKPVTTGEGGVLVTNNPAIATTVKALRNQGRSEQDSWLTHSLLGYNFRLPEINCALGIVQLSRLEGILKRREALARRYSELLAIHCPAVECPPLDLPDSRISWFAFVAKLRATFGRTARDIVVQKMIESGIGCRAYFPPIHRMQLYSQYSTAPLPVTDELSSRTLALPFFNHLREDDMLEVCCKLQEITAALPKT